MDNLMNIHGLQVKQYYTSTSGVEELNNFLLENDGNIVDIQFRTTQMSTYVLVTYYVSNR